MIKNTKEVIINEKPYELNLAIRNMLAIEKISGKSFMTLMKETEGGSITPIALLLAGCLETNKKPVGLDFVEGLEYDTFNDLISPLMECIVGAMPTGEKK